MFRHVVGSFILIFCFASAAIAQEAQQPIFGVELDRGIVSYRRGDFASSLQQFRPLADKGDALAQYFVGIQYVLGQGVGQNDAEGLKWLRQSAAQENPDACFNLGLLIMGNRVSGATPKNAHDFFLRAARMGHPEAMFALGQLYRRGIPNYYEADVVAAAVWYEGAAEYGFPPALRVLGQIHRDGLLGKRDMNEARRLLSAAAQQGDKEAINDLRTLPTR